MPSDAPIGRLGLLAGLLTEALSRATRPGELARVLDCGGGTGTAAVPLAVAGGEVTVLDISADALATLRRRAVEAGVGDRIRPMQGDVEALAGVLPADEPAYDLVLAHGILDAVDDVPATFAALVGVLRPGGLVSVLVGNPNATVIARASAGDPAGALRELRTGAAEARCTPQRVEQLCAEHGVTVQARHGIGVFADLVPGSALDTSAARQSLAELEAEAAARPPFADLAGRIHLLARRPAG